MKHSVWFAIVFLSFVVSTPQVPAQQPPSPPEKKQDDPPEVDLSSFKKRANFLAGSSILLVIEFDVMAGFESFPILEERLPRLKGFADEVVTELRAKDAARRVIATDYLAKLACLVRTTAWARGDDGDDVFPVALGRHAQPIQDALEAALKNGSTRERIEVAAILLAIDHRHTQATDILVQEMQSDQKPRRVKAFEMVGMLRLTSPAVIAALAADRHVDMRLAAAFAASKIGPRKDGGNANRSITDS